MRIPYKRKREGKTNYAKRLNLLVSRKARVVVRKSLKGVSVQVVSYHKDGDKILASAYTRDLKKLGLSQTTSNIPLAYLTGLLCGVRAKKAGVSEAIADFGLQRAHPKGKLYAAIKGVLDAGVTVPCGKEVLPDDSRILGDHIKAYAEQKGKTLTISFDKLKESILQ